MIQKGNRQNTAKPPAITYAAIPTTRSLKLLFSTMDDPFEGGLRVRG
jgi:hypothetical protein